jgi:type VI secretion system secreted protein VgrG
LDADGDPNALFIFQIDSSLTTASGSDVDVINGNSGTGIFWEVGSSATLGTSSVMAGNIVADQSITVGTSATILCGRALALNGAVTLDGNTISDSCTSGGDYGSGRSDFGSEGFAAESSTITAGAPEPGTIWLICGGLLVIAGHMGTQRRHAAERGK